MPKMQFAPARAAIIGLPVLFAATAARASVLPPLPDTEYANFAQAIYTLHAAGRSNGVSSFSGTASASTQNDYSIPYLSASANSPAGAGANSESYLAYYMRISGPTSTVQVLLEAEGQTTAAGSFVFPTASLDILGTINGGEGLSFKACSNCSGSSGFSINRTYTFEIDSIYAIKMDATVLAGFGSGTAWVDPFFDVPDGFTIAFSDGIGNSPLVASVPRALHVGNDDPWLRRVGVRGVSAPISA